MPDIDYGTGSIEYTDGTSRMETTLKKYKKMKKKKKKTKKGHKSK